MELLHRPHPHWDIARLLALIRDRECRRSDLHDVLSLPLTPAWRKLFVRRMEMGTVEDWTARMNPGA